MRYTPNLFTVVFICVFCFTLSSCDENGSGKNETERVEKPEALDQVIQRKLESVLDDAIDNEGRVEDSIVLISVKETEAFYSDRSYQHAWSSQSKWTTAADSLMEFISNCRLYGLFPQDYHYREINIIANRFLADTLTQTDRLDAHLWVKADLMLTDAFFTIARHLHKGRMLPDSVLRNADSLLPADFYQRALQRVVKGESITSVFTEMEPEHQAYIDLKSGLKSFLDSADFKHRYTYVGYPFKDSLKFVKSLVRRLREEGVLSWQLQVVDSAALSAAILKVQKQHKLTADGKAGIQLATYLNNNDPEKFIRIAINLDRYKMIPHPMPERYIWVNLPGFYLKIIDEDTIALESRVVVGNPKTRTPLLTSRVSDMVTYPQWTIPTSIIVKEILPALKRDPGYLARKGYMLLSWKEGGEPVDPYSVNWSKYQKGIPYKIVQGSGDDNALGVFKFNFPNAFSVYMHDTNQRYLFKNENRALSHGCVRVQDWEKMTWYISRLDSVRYENDTSINRRMPVPADSIKSWLARKEKHVIPVRSNLPVYFRYITAELKKGKLVFYSDIYGEDRVEREAYFSNK